MNQKIRVFLILLLFSTHAFSDELIVKLRSQLPLPLLGDTFSVERRELELATLRPVADGMFLLVEGDLGHFQGNPFVEYAEPNFAIHLVGNSCCGSMPAITEKSWGITRIQAPEAWARKFTGQNIVAAVVDTGIDATHPALSGKVLSGYNFVANNSSPVDDNGHGTHVSGTLVGRWIGVAPDAKIIPIKMLDSKGTGYLSAALDAIHYATAQGAQVQNHSWAGGPDFYSQALLEVITEANTHHVLFVAAAGNNSSNNDTVNVYPANIPLPNVVSVAATDSNDNLAIFSDYGPKSVYLAAPGKDINSSLPNNKYGFYSGTSMAAPHVSGVIALMLSAGVQASEIRTKLIQTSDAHGYPVISLGLIDALRAVE